VLEAGERLLTARYSAFTLSRPGNLRNKHRSLTPRAVLRRCRVVRPDRDHNTEAQKTSLEAVNIEEAAWQTGLPGVHSSEAPPQPVRH